VKILDRYILTTFLVSLVICLAAMMGLALLLDFSFNRNKFLDLAAETEEAGLWGLLAGIADYYVYRAFHYFQLLAAPTLLVSAAASMVRLNRNRELTSIKAAGVSLYRVMWPMTLVGLILDGFYIVNQEFIIPGIAVELARDPDDLAVQENFAVDFVRDEHNNIIYAPIYDPKARQMRAEKKVFEDGSIVFSARVRIFQRDSKYKALGTIEAEGAKWDEANRRWVFTNGVKLPPIEEATLLERIPTGPEGEPQKDYYTNVGPRQLLRHRTSDFYRYMSYAELKSLAEDPMRGNRRQLQVEMHQHMTGPILNVLILLLGMPFVAAREDRSYAASISVAVLLFIGVFAVRFVSTAFGNAGHVGPLLAAWLPIFIVLPASILSMESLRT
jgi:lipopolysaccharide export system permease protein